MKKAITLLVVLLAISYTTPVHSQLVNWERRNKSSQKILQYSGIIVSLNIKTNEIAVRNTDLKEEKTFIINDINLLYSLNRNDKVLVKYGVGSNIAQTVSIIGDN